MKKGSRPRRGSSARGSGTKGAEAFAPRTLGLAHVSAYVPARERAGTQGDEKARMALCGASALRHVLRARPKRDTGIWLLPSGRSARLGIRFDHRARIPETARDADLLILAQVPPQSEWTLLVGWRAIDSREDLRPMGSLITGERRTMDPRMWPKLARCEACTLLVWPASSRHCGADSCVSLVDQGFRHPSLDVVLERGPIRDEPPPPT